MHVNQERSNLLEHAHGNGGVIDESATLSVEADFAAHDTFTLVEIYVVRLQHAAEHWMSRHEDTFHDTFFVAVANGASVGTPAHHEANGSEDDALSRTRFTRDDGEARRPVSLQFINESVVRYGEMFQHEFFGEMVCLQKMPEDLLTAFCKQGSAFRHIILLFDLSPVGVL